MKKILFAMLLLGLAVACKTTKDTFQLSKEEFDKFSTKEYEIFYEGKPVAIFEVMELEYYQGKLSNEFSVIPYEKYPSDFSEKILRYLHMRYPDAKLEIKFIKDTTQQDTEESI